jgi:ferrous iron transport protein A
VPLASIPKGTRIIISDVAPGQARLQLIRFGLLVGQPVRCIQKLPGGTVVIESNRQEIAIGADLAKAISVMPQND